MPNPRRRAGGRLQAWALALSLSLSCTAAAAQAAELVVAAISAPFSLPLHVAERQGFFAAEGVSVRLESCPVAQPCLQQIFDGKAHLVTASDVSVMFNSFERGELSVLATLASSTSNIRIVGRRSAGIDKAASLAGKRVGVQARGNLQYYLGVYLLYHGIEPNRVRTLPVAPAGVVEALVSGQIDAAVIPVHLMSEIEQRLGKDAVRLDQPRILTETLNLVSSRALPRQRQADLVKLLRAVSRAQAFIAAEPAQAASILASKMKLEPASAAAILAHFDYRLGLDSSLPGRLERAARWALREGHVPAGRPIPQYLQFVAAAPLRAAVPGVLQD